MTTKIEIHAGCTEDKEIQFFIFDEKTDEQINSGKIASGEKREFTIWGNHVICVGEVLKEVTSEPAPVDVELSQEATLT